MWRDFFVAAISQRAAFLFSPQAAWYPDNPSPDEQTMMTNFFEALARFYPCTYCADDFAKNLRKSPVP